MYGVAGGTFDGNNVLDAYAATRLAADHARAGNGPTLLIAETFRMGGHATHDEREARSLFAAELFAGWGRRDPVGLYEAWLEGEGIGRAVLEEIEARVQRRDRGRRRRGHPQPRDRHARARNPPRRASTREPRAAGHGRRGAWLHRRLQRRHGPGRGDGRAGGGARIRAQARVPARAAGIRGGPFGGCARRPSAATPR